VFTDKYQQIWELTPRNHPDHLPMFSLYHSTNLVIKVMQEVKAREEELNYIKELAARLTGLPHKFQLACRERRLVAQGLLCKVELLDSDKELLDGSGFSSASNQGSLPWAEGHQSPARSPMFNAPPIPELEKVGPITSPLFPSYHNRTPVMAALPSPYTPRRSYMSAASRASTALSDASRISEWTTAYSPTDSLVIPSDFDDIPRPDSSASSILSGGHIPFVPYGRNSPENGGQRRNDTKTPKRSTRLKGPKEAPVYVFVFTDLVLLTSQNEKAGLFPRKLSQIASEKLTLIDEIGLSRVLGVTNRSGKLGKTLFTILSSTDAFDRLRASHPNRSFAYVPTGCWRSGLELFTRCLFCISHPANNWKCSPWLRTC